MSRKRLVEQARAYNKNRLPPEHTPRRSIDCGICDGTGFVYPVEEAVEPCPLCAGLGSLTLELVNGEVSDVPADRADT